MKEGDVRRIAEQPGTGAAPAERLLAPPPPRPLRALRAEGDARVWPYTFQAFACAHPRLDVHARMADGLVAFLQSDVPTP